MYVGERSMFPYTSVTRLCHDRVVSHDLMDLPGK